MTDPAFLGQAGHDAAHGWMVDALCATHPDPELWFPTTGDPMTVAAPAIAVCQSCPVRQPCLDFAMTDLRIEGVWGGLTHAQRRGNRRGSR